MEETKCYLCEASSSTPYYVLPDRLIGRPNVHATLVKCNECGLVYQNPRPTLQEMEFHYPSEYESYVAEPEVGSTLQSISVRYGLRKRIRFVTRHIQRGRLLDVGCAAGVFLRSMRELEGWEVSGVDVNAYAVSLARARYGLDVRLGTLEQADYPSSYFDAITLWDVLEHLHSPVNTLREITRLLKPGGIVIARVPNLRSWDASLFGPYWAGLDAPRHLYVFTPATLSKTFQLAGLQPVSWSGGIGAYPTFLLSARFWLQAHPNQQILSRIVGWLHQPILRLATAPMFFLSGLVLRGPLMVVTARLLPS